MWIVVPIIKEPIVKEVGFNIITRTLNIHSNYQSAINEAKRLANGNPGQAFKVYMLKDEGYAVASLAEWHFGGEE